MPVETAINNVEGVTASSDKGAVQKHVDDDNLVLPYQTHFSHVKVSREFLMVQRLTLSPTLSRSLLYLIRSIYQKSFDREFRHQIQYIRCLINSYVAIFQTALFSLSVKRADGSILGHEEVVNQLNE